MECSLYLARLLLGCGQGEAARDILQQLDADIETHQLTLPDTQGQQLLLLLSKASLHLHLGQREAFAASLLPQFTGLLDQAENNAAVVAAAKKVIDCGGRQPKILCWLTGFGNNAGFAGLQAPSVLTHLQYLLCAAQARRLP